MKRKRQLLYLFILACLLAIATPAGAGLLAQEIDLNQMGEAYELNLDSQGMLWVSEAAGEIWRVDPTNEQYTIYPVGGGPSDARGDGAGHAWWVDFNTNRLGRLTLGVAQVDVDIWEIPEEPSELSGLYSTAIDSEGDIWFTDYYDPKLYELDPDQAQDNLCVYDLPDLGLGIYMAISGQNLWLGDTWNGRLLRLDTADDATHTFTWWQLPANSYPQGIAVDGAGQVWWADTTLGTVGRLVPGEPNYTAFDPPDIDPLNDQTPQMLALRGDQVWVSLQNTGGIGVLDPATASFQEPAVTSDDAPVTPTCSDLAATIHSTLDPTPIPVDASWINLSYATALEQDGWRIFSSPEGAVPWGIASASEMWMVDQGRQKLARLEFGGNLYLPVVVKP